MGRYIFAVQSNPAAGLEQEYPHTGFHEASRQGASSRA